MPDPVAYKGPFYLTPNNLLGYYNRANEFVVVGDDSSDVVSVNDHTGAVTGAQAVAGADIAPGSIAVAGPINGGGPVTAAYFVSLAEAFIFNNQGRFISTADGAFSLLAANASTPGNLALGNLTASGTISGGRVCRVVTADVTAIISGDQPDDVFFVHSSSAPINITIPGSGNSSQGARPFTIIDVDGYADSNPISVFFPSSGYAFSLVVPGGRLEILLDGGDAIATGHVISHA